ncbi:MAG: hypothetical protein HYW38_01435 [Candidatus Colwellbacteria bacterium]|nr:hypothetical protein [Candidatus Colwellbacteria bacterium]
MDEAVKERKLIRSAAIKLGVILLIVHLIAIIGRWYHTYPSIDIPQHFLGGIFAALIFYWFHYSHPGFFKLVPGTPAPAVLVVSWAAFLGVLFEFSEFIFDFIFFDYLGISSFPSQLSLRDTMGDLFFDILGGLALAIFMRLRYDKRKRQL